MEANIQWGIIFNKLKIRAVKSPFCLLLCYIKYDEKRESYDN